jgi:hypothetical protein
VSTVVTANGACSGVTLSTTGVEFKMYEKVPISWSMKVRGKVRFQFVDKILSNDSRRAP